VINPESAIEIDRAMDIFLNAAAGLLSALESNSGEAFIHQNPRRLAPLKGALHTGSSRTDRQSGPAADRGKRLLGSRCKFRVRGSRRDFLGALEVGYRAVDRGAINRLVMPDDDRVIALKRLERLENDYPMVEVICPGEDMLVR
jgi:hypothetical protein